MTKMIEPESADSNRPQTRGVSGCCAVEVQSTCCEPAEKSACCGTAAGTSCGCQGTAETRR